MLGDMTIQERKLRDLPETGLLSFAKFGRRGQPGAQPVEFAGPTGQQTLEMYGCIFLQCWKTLPIKNVVCWTSPAPRIQRFALWQRRETGIDTGCKIRWTYIGQCT
jgi:hypothetical protein